jgi:hypothetical protein
MSGLRREEESNEARRARVLRQLGHFRRDAADPIERWKESALSRALDAAGTPVRPRIEVGVSLGFAITGILAGLPFGPSGPLLVSAALLTVVLVPELARSLLLRVWGRSALVLVSPGGASLEVRGAKLTKYRGFVLGSVGPIASVVLAGLLLLVSRHWTAGLTAAIHTLALWHGIWGLAQALPLAPFSVGLALQARLPRPYRALHQVFSTKVVVLGGLVAAKVFPFAFPLVMLATGAAVAGFIRAYQAAVDEKTGVSDDVVRSEALVASGDAAEALRVARKALARARSSTSRVRLWKSLAWGAIGHGDPFVAHGALGALPISELDVHVVASYLAACNRRDEALELLERARVEGERSRETTKLMLDLLLDRGELVQARRIVADDHALLSSDEAALVERAICEATASAMEPRCGTSP